jgi:hypothetical protein
VNLRPRITRMILQVAILRSQQPASVDETGIPATEAGGLLDGMTFANHGCRPALTRRK